jgi:light-regulated signal transduction histidine kinase (bacteriophytochrome)
MNKEVNLTNCDREPIHIPGSVQPFGFLLALLSDFSVAIASTNVSAWLGFDHAELLQRSFADVFSSSAVAAIRTRIDYLSGEDAVERMFGVTLQDGGKPFDLAIHFSGPYLVIEAEPSVVEQNVNSGELVRLMLGRVRKAPRSLSSSTR